MLTLGWMLLRIGLGKAACTGGGARPEGRSKRLSSSSSSLWGSLVPTLFCAACGIVVRTGSCSFCGGAGGSSAAGSPAAAPPNGPNGPSGSSADASCVGCATRRRTGPRVLRTDDLTALCAWLELSGSCAGADEPASSSFGQHAYYIRETKGATNSAALDRARLRGLTAMGHL